MKYAPRSSHSHAMPSSSSSLWYAATDDCSSACRPAADSSIGASLQRAANLSSHPQSDGSNRGATRNGASRLNIIGSVFAIAPGIANGSAWLGEISPQLPCEHAAPNVSRSTIVTSHPRLRR